MGAGRGAGSAPALRRRHAPSRTESGERLDARPPENESAGVPRHPMRTTRATTYPACLLAAALSIAACGDAPHPLERVRAGEAKVTGEGVLVIVVDGLRWDHTSLAGYDRDTTPFLREFARDGIVFEDVWSPVPSLVGSHVAILTGSHPALAQPPALGGRAKGEGLQWIPSSEPPVLTTDRWLVPPALWLIGRSFLGSGYTTGAFVDHPLIGELRGFDRGFKEFSEFGGDAEQRDSGIGVYGVGRRFLSWVNDQPLDQDWFAYVHMNDLERSWFQEDEAPGVRGALKGTGHWEPRPSLDWVPPVGFTEPQFHVLPPSRASQASPLTLGEYELRYDLGIRALDASLARVIGHAEDFGRKKDLTIVVVGSFGTGLGEHGLYLQAGMSEEEDLRVPLVIRPSERLAKELGWTPLAKGDPQRVSSALVGLVDVAPTLVDLAGARAPDRQHGLSLRPLLTGERASIRRRLFATSSMIPGVGIVEPMRHTSFYHADLAPPVVARSWQRADEDVRVQFRDGLPVETDAAALEGIGRTWLRWLDQDRHALHFGRGGANPPPLLELRSLQVESPDGLPR